MFSKIVSHVITISFQVFVGETASRLSVRLLANIAQGKGDTLPLDTVSLYVVTTSAILYIYTVHVTEQSLSDERSKVHFIRPLRFGQFCCFNIVHLWIALKKL